MTVPDQTRTVTVTPSLASEWLEVPFARQRKTSRDTVRRYAATMAAGGWRLTPTPIILGPGLEVVDGRHRLEAVIVAGVPVTFVVARTNDLDVFSVIDQGRRRAAYQFVGTAYPEFQTRAAVLVMAYERTGGNAAGVMPHAGHADYTLAAVLETVDRMDAAELTKRVITASRPMRVNAGTLLAVTWLGSHGASPESVDEWLEGIETGADLAAGDPRLAFRNRFAGATNRASSHAVRRRVWGMTVKAWNAWELGTPIRMLRHNPSEEMPLIVGSRVWLEARD